MLNLTELILKCTLHLGPTLSLHTVGDLGQGICKYCLKRNKSVVF